MKLKVTFAELNPDFDKKYAEMYHFGKESESNWKTNWGISLQATSEVDKIVLTESGSVPCTYTHGDETIDVVFTNMTILDCYIGDDVTNQFAVSNNMLESTSKFFNKKTNTTRFYFYFKHDIDFIQFNNTLYILEDEIPAELRE